MYFYKSYGLHTSYWHDFFGLQNSHGCVNLAPKDALWLFQWTSPKRNNKGKNWQEATQADPGTWVWVHETPVAVGGVRRVIAE
jgi:lipoprotein-anchoring transpeptidase ErfK/SrfK